MKKYLILYQEPWNRKAVQKVEKFKVILELNPLSLNMESKPLNKTESKTSTNNIIL